MTRIPIWKIPNDTCSVGRSIKMCLSSLPGLIRALSKISALLVEARTMTWSVVPMPAKEEEVSILPEKRMGCSETRCFTHHPSLLAAGWESAPPQCWRNLTCWWSASFPQHRSHRCRRCRVLECEPPWINSWPEQHPGLQTNTSLYMIWFCWRFPPEKGDCRKVLVHSWSCDCWDFLCITVTAHIHIKK